MSGFDEGAVYYNDLGATFDIQEATISKATAHKKFFEFLRSCQAEDGTLKYRDALEKSPKTLEVSLDDLTNFDDELASLLKKNPGDFHPLMEAAASDVIWDVRSRAAEGEDHPRASVQVLLRSSEHPLSIRALGAAHISRLVVIPGIVIAASKTKAKATAITLMCKNCKNTKVVLCKPGLGGAAIPRVCDARPPGDNLGEPCPLDPFEMVPSASQYMDHQTLKLQESPEDVPTGELPRTALLSVDRSLAQKITPGSRVRVVGVFSIFQSASSAASKGGKAAVAIRQPYVRVLGLEQSADGGAGRSADGAFSAEEVRSFKEFAAQAEPVAAVRRLIAPAIFGGDDVKAAIACLLFGGARKHLPDGARLRGDVNVLLIGDPSTAKSQFLKFVEKTAPIAVYTSGKGSSAAGLTASVTRDPQSGEFYLEGGAMVLADGGVVCIDEFDKMRPEDRVAIHEAMEQQTISIAKAAITTVLNSRAAVLAAANPPSGRYDDLKSAQENIDLQTTILSRFDLIFIVKDERDFVRDMAIARHVLGVHRDAEAAAAATQPGDGPADGAPAGGAGGPLGGGAGNFLRRYIGYCKRYCSPRLTEPAAALLAAEYVRIRQDVRDRARASKEASAVPITVRQLEAIIRVSESLARIGLRSTATEEHVREALRLFRVSTIAAAESGLADAVAVSAEQRAELLGVEAHVKRRVPIGATTSKRKVRRRLIAACLVYRLGSERLMLDSSQLCDDLMRLGLPERLIHRALLGMTQRKEIDLTREGRSIARRS